MLEETIVGLFRMVGYVKIREELAVVNGFVQEVAVKSSHHDINKGGVGLVGIHLLLEGGHGCSMPVLPAEAGEALK
jgi:DNA helicase TIP49 (TBP-interacting protein)